jgi:uncharacterized membrane protein YvbJ
MQCLVMLIAMLANVAMGQRTAAEVGDYQIILWTSVVLVLIVLGVVYMMLGMDSKKDPALYAQVVDPRQNTKKQR